jgi:hypothetical protein
VLVIATRLLLATALAAMAVPPPVTVEPDSQGRVHISVAAGKASYEAKTFDCSGEVIGTEPVDMSSWGARVDYDLNDVSRLTALGGAISTPERAFAQEGPFDEDDIKYYDGAFGGLQFAREDERTGFGVGLVFVTGHDNFTCGSMFLRIGPRDGVYFRGEVMPAEPAFGATGWVRIGVGHGMTSKRQVGWFAGASAAPYTYGDAFEPRLFADLRLPVLGDFDLLVGGQVGDGEDQAQWSASAGLRWTP